MLCISGGDLSIWTLLNRTTATWRLDTQVALALDIMIPLVSLNAALINDIRWLISSKQPAAQSVV